jgi:hypothetical protein
MKTDLSEEEFRQLVTALAHRFETDEFELEAFPIRPSPDALPGTTAAS